VNPDFLVNAVLRGVLGSRPKRSRNALGYLTGRKGGSLVTPGNILAVAGLAWGIYETLHQKSGSSPTGVPASSANPPDSGVPPTAPVPRQRAMVASVEDDIDDAVRMVRLAISAAHADGTMSDDERDAIVRQAAEGGAGDLVAREIENRRPLAEIVAGVADPALRATLYVLAYTVLRADEQVSGPERIYLAQLAHLLELDPPTVQALERDASGRIDAIGKKSSGEQSSGDSRLIE
jgi:uncharacterized membrane protein YebE (DUF533 family)